MKYFKEIILALGVIAVFWKDASQGSVLFFIAVGALYAFIMHEETKERALAKLSKEEKDWLIKRIDSVHDELLASVASQTAQIVELERAAKDSAKAIEESKKFVSQANLGLGFRAVKRAE
jgi:hypothetical protein